MRSKPPAVLPALDSHRCGNRALRFALRGRAVPFEVHYLCEGNRQEGEPQPRRAAAPPGSSIASVHERYLCGGLLRDWVGAFLVALLLSARSVVLTTLVLAALMLITILWHICHERFLLLARQSGRVQTNCREGTGRAASPYYYARASTRSVAALAVPKGERSRNSEAVRACLIV